jgi:uncharacterized protein involved in tolerance to divalent cations
MRRNHIYLLACALSIAALLAIGAVAQNNPSSDASTAPKQSQSNRIRIEVVGGDADAPVENASVYLKYVEERKLRKDKKIELNVKTNREGVAHIPDAPMGKVLVQVIAEGWKTYGKWMEITDSRQTIKVKLDKPPRWY